MKLTITLNTCLIILSYFFFPPLAVAGKCHVSLGSDGETDRTSGAAYSRDSKIIFYSHSPGLLISFIKAPDTDLSAFGFGAVETFTLAYNPSEFFPGSLLRRALGSKPLHYSLEDVRQFQNGYFSELGDSFYVYLRHPRDKKRTSQEGPLMIISKKTGQILFFPAGTNADSFFILNMASSLLSDTQQKWGRKFFGDWTEIRDASAAEAR